MMRRTKRRSGVVLLDMLRLLSAVLLPPLGVFFTVGISLHFWINLVLTILGYLPGICHAIWIVATRTPLSHRL